MSAFLNENSFLLVQMVLAAMLGISLYLPLMSGQLSLASPGFYALGGYIAAIISTRIYPVGRGELYPLRYLLLEMGLGGLASGLLALLVGVTALRLRGIYLALATIAFVEILRVVSLNLELTGGAVGIFNIPQPFDSQLNYLWVAGPLLLSSMLFAWRLERIKVGRAFTALREDELAAGAMGINPTYHKVLAFTMGAVLAGMVGALSAHFINTWNARQGTFDASITYLTYVLIGGSRTVVGPVVGGMVLSALPELLRRPGIVNSVPAWMGELLVNGRLIIFGVLIVVGSIFFPQGLITPGLFARRPARPKERQRHAANTEPS